MKYIIVDKKIQEIIKIRKCDYMPKDRFGSSLCSCKEQKVFYVKGKYADFPYCFLGDKLIIYNSLEKAQTALLLESL